MEHSPGLSTTINGVTFGHHTHALAYLWYEKTFPHGTMMLTRSRPGLVLGKFPTQPGTIAFCDLGM